jgi:hypothetical protein
VGREGGDVTIECHGHVESLSQSRERHLGKNGIAIAIQLEASRGTATIVLHADCDEADFYRIGMPIILQLRPNVAMKAAT